MQALWPGRPGAAAFVSRRWQDEQAVERCASVACEKVEKSRSCAGHASEYFGALADENPAPVFPATPREPLSATKASAAQTKTSNANVATLPAFPSDLDKPSHLGFGVGTASACEAGSGALPRLT